MRNTITHFRFACIAIAFVSFQWEAHSQTTKPPNIVIIYADDLGYGDVQCYNPDRGKIATPHIDQLATEGKRFTDAHSSSAVCSPSRYTLLTGRYHWRTRLQKGIVGLWGEPLIAPDRMTIASLAKKANYRTACIGKWHLGWDWPIDSADKNLFFTRGKKAVVASDEHREAWQRTFSQPIVGGPTTRGFDTYFGTDVPNWPPYCFIENDRTVGIPTEYAKPELFRKNQASLQGPALKDWTLEPILPALGDRTTQFIRNNADATEPFLIFLSLTSPHTPLSVNEEWKGKSGLGLYADLVMETDSIVGQVMDSLRANSISEDTLVVFTSDNGCAHYIGVKELERQGHFPSGALRGYKSDVWEGGHRVPFIVRWPGVIAPGTVSNQLVHQADLLATLADITGQDVPENMGEDSFSLMKILNGEDIAVREHAVSCSIQGLPSIREGSWKLILGSGSGGWTEGADEHRVQLYNLENDLGETRNLASTEPERVNAMKSLMEKLIGDGRSTQGARLKNDVDVRRYPLKATTSS